MPALLRPIDLDTRFHDEIFFPDGMPRPFAEAFVDRLDSFTDGELVRRQRTAQITLRDMGITFHVYGDDDGVEKIWPLDVIPRLIPGSEWERVERGLKQRIRALNLFLEDVYNERRILRDGVVPEALIESSPSFQKRCLGQRPPSGVWCHVTGTDLVRDADGEIYVLEDNLRVPSGVSYVLENREVMKRTFPQIFQGLNVAPVEDYPERLLETLLDTAPTGTPDPCVVLLTPGPYNSAYFEHCFLAQQMGVELVQGSDLVVSGGHVHMRTTKGLRRVDVIYRRIDDDFLDPTWFRHDSMLGVPGLMNVYAEGRVTLANAPGNGIADDKAVYAYVPAIIRYYLDEDPIVSNVPTYLLEDPKQLRHVIDHMHEMVVKPCNESGGYGILIGPQASKAQLADYADRIRSDPRNYIAQPLLRLSTVPTVVDDHLEGRHVDLRPFILCGAEDVYVLPGGLTRVALRKGSTVVNSSQGGGSKDTWVIARASL